MVLARLQSLFGNFRTASSANQSIAALPIKVANVLIKLEYVGSEEMKALWKVLTAAPLKIVAK